MSSDRSFVRRSARRLRDTSAVRALLSHRSSSGPDDLAGAVVVVSFGRSGTTVFSEFLRTHPAVETRGELLNEYAYHSFFRSREGLRARLSPGMASSIQSGVFAHMRRITSAAAPGKVVFDLKFESLHLADGNWRLPGPRFSIIDRSIEAGASVVMVVRRSQVDRVASVNRASGSGRFHSFQSGGDEVRSVIIDESEFAYSLEEVYRTHEYVRRRYGSSPRFLEVEFESFFEPDGTDRAGWFTDDLARRLSSLLGVADSFERRPRLERVSTTGHDDVVHDYERLAGLEAEVRRRIESTR